MHDDIGVEEFANDGCGFCGGYFGCVSGNNMLWIALQTVYDFLICGIITLLQNTNYDDDDGDNDDSDYYYYYYQRPTVNMIVTIVTSINFAKPR